MKHQLLTLLFLLCCFFTHAQEYTGLWHGYMKGLPRQRVKFLNTGYVIRIKDQDQNIINGKAYVFRRGKSIYEGILDFIGVVNNRQLKITELKILHSRVPNDSTFLCIKNLNLEFMQDSSTEHLYGKWTGELENRDPCYPGEAFLSRLNLDEPNDIPHVLLQQILKDSTELFTFLKTRLSKPVIINVSNNVVQLEIKDYLKQDGDIVSVYNNRKLFIKNLKIVHKPYKQTIRLDKRAGLHEIILYAENLGEIPPNTSIMTIIDGPVKHRLIIQSTEQESAVVYLHYDPPN